MKNTKALIAVVLLLILVICNSCGIINPGAFVNALQNTPDNNKDNTDNPPSDSNHIPTDNTPVIPEPIVYSEFGTFETENQLSLKLSVEWNVTWVDNQQNATIKVDVYLLYTSVQFLHDKTASISVSDNKQDFIVKCHSDVRVGSYDIMKLHIQSFTSNVPCDNGYINIPICARMYFGGVYSGVNVVELIASKNIVLIFEQNN